MRRIGAIFIAVCMMLIAASIGVVLYLGFKLDAGISAIVSLAALTGMALFNSISNRLRDRGDLGDQIGDLSRGTADLARQVAEISRRLNAVELKIASPVNRARGASDPLATEIGEAQLVFGFEQLECARLLGLVNPQNTASIRALEKLGMRCQGTVADPERGPRRVYVIEAGEWRQRRAE